MNRFLQATIVLLLILLAITNPPLEKHQKAISASFAKEHKVAGALGVGYVCSTLFRYRNYTFFSLTRYEEKIRSVGVLG